MFTAFFPALSERPVWLSVVYRGKSFPCMCPHGKQKYTFLSIPWFLTHSHHSSQPFNSFNARQSWSGQEVYLSPQRIPSSLLITSSIFWPVTNRQMPCRLPLHPPKKYTCWMMSLSSAVTSISTEQVPCVWYCICFMFWLLVCLYVLPFLDNRCCHFYLFHACNPCFRLQRYAYFPERQK